MEQFQDGISGFERFIEIMDTKPESDNPIAKDITNVEGNIEIKGLSFRYGEGREVLKNLNLTVKKGQKFALVGPSGGGKTTICHLIPHFYDISEGEIFIDGNEIHNITLSSLQGAIGIVQQDVYLFNSTIKENILYGKPTASDDEVVKAAKRANIHDFIIGLPVFQKIVYVVCRNSQRRFFPVGIKTDCGRKPKCTQRHYAGKQYAK